MSKVSEEQVSRSISYCGFAVACFTIVVYDWVLTVGQECVANNQLLSWIACLSVVVYDWALTFGQEVG
ncbi:hypothetical protein AZE42_08105 [Rhizopogon vesiculosus]|uniref:DUF6533 domain-containing protein n=1 Tax=Rhizopogon vesiculosus TaxID=180088 RepID=A0A1J8Q0V3_9AGAM|nr:hypothetical protein AZE42_08105 [Rhizopogon vesiculosus]